LNSIGERLWDKIWGGEGPSKYKGKTLLFMAATYRSSSPFISQNK